MAEVDVYILSFLQNFLPLCLFFCAVWCFKILKNYYEKKVFKLALCYHDLVTQRLKLQLLAPIHSTVSKDWYLRNRGYIRILEIGVCTGINLKYYPNNSRIIVADTLYNLENFFVPVRSQIRNVQLEGIVELGEDDMLNLPDNCVDAVVGFHMLCQRKSMIKVVKEIYRVLAPGGRYYFMEHKHDIRNKKLYYEQKLLSLTRVWPFIFNNCRLDRNPERAIVDVPFGIRRFEFVVMEFPEFNMLNFLGTHVLGYAEK